MRRISGIKIERVSIIDDEPANREGYKLHVEDSEMIPILEAGPFMALDRCVEHVKTSVQAVLSDYKLRVRNFAAFNGAELVAALYDKKIPAVMCTKRESIEIAQIRPFLSRIPALLHPNDLNPDAFVAALTQCIGEFNGKFVQARKGWRAVVQIEEIENDLQGTTVVLSVPSWTTGILLRLRREELPSAVELKEGDSLYARVNTGAERPEELYFTDWEVP